MREIKGAGGRTLCAYRSLPCRDITLPRIKHEVGPLGYTPQRATVAGGLSNIRGFAWDISVCSTNDSCLTSSARVRVKLLLESIPSNSSVQPYGSNNNRLMSFSTMSNLLRRSFKLRSLKGVSVRPYELNERFAACIRSPVVVRARHS